MFKDKSAERVLFVVTCISALFIIAEFAGGILSNSLSIISDAGHLLSDFFSFVISLIMIRISKFPGYFLKLFADTKKKFFFYFILNFIIFE